MKKLLLAIITLAQFSSFAQSKTVDSLKALLQNHKLDTIQCNNYMVLALHYENSSYDSAIKYSNQAVLLAQKLNFNKGLFAAYNYLGTLNAYKNDLDKALAYFTKCQQLAIQTDDKKQLGWAYHNCGNIYIYKADYPKATELHEKALEVRQSIDDKIDICASYNNLGYILKSQGKYKDATQFYLKSLNIAEKMKPSKALQQAYLNLGVIYYQLKNYDESLKFLNKTLDVPIGGKVDRAITIEMKSSIYIEKKDYKTAMKLLEESLKIYEEVGDKSSMAGAYGNLAEIYLTQNTNLEIAEKYATQSLAIIEAGGTTRALPLAYSTVAKIYLQKNEFTKSVTFFLKAKKLAYQMNQPEDLKTIYKNLSEAYLKMNDFESSLKNYKEYTTLSDSLSGVQKTKEINELNIQYNTEKKEQENRLQKSEISRKNQILWSVIGLSILLFILSYLFYNRRKLQQEAKLQTEVAKQQELATQAVLDAEERERTRIAADLHDGVGQTIMALKMNLAGINDYIEFKNPKAKNVFEKALDLATESAKEVRSISHQMMPNALIKSGLASAIREFISKVEAPNLKINLNVSNLNESIEPNIEKVLYRVIQESVNNVIKHAQANQLNIQLSKNKNSIEATIEDNGVGFDSKGTDYEGIGLKNIRDRVAFLKGNVDISSQKGKGTLLAIQIPI